MEITAVYSDDHVIQMNTICESNYELTNDKTGDI